MSLTYFTRAPIYQVRIVSRHHGVTVPTNVLDIQTSKSIGDPAGQFSITFDLSTSPFEGAGAPIDELVEANDYVEIRLGAEDSGDDPHMNFPDTPVVMRGFVDSVRRIENPGAGGGGPMRTIVVAGRDYGKIWSVVKLANIYPPYTTDIMQLLVNFYGIDADHLIQVPLPTVWEDTMEKILRPYTLAHTGTPAFVSDSSDIPSILHVPTVMSSQEFEVIYLYLKQYVNAPWIEMFVRDEETAPTFYLRWCRVFDSQLLCASPFGTIGMGPGDRTHILTDYAHLMPTNQGRTDNEVENYFFTYNDLMGTAQATPLVDASTPGENPYIAKDSIDWYGLRPVKGGIVYMRLEPGQSESEIDQALRDHKNIATLFNLWLVRMYAYEELRWNATIEVRGTPAIRVGDRVQLLDEDRIYYCEGVEQHFSVMGMTYTTQLSLVQGLPVNGGSGLGQTAQQLAPHGIPSQFVGNQNVPGQTVGPPDVPGHAGSGTAPTGTPPNTGILPRDTTYIPPRG